MKTLKILSLFLILSLFCSSACKKETKETSFFKGEDVLKLLPADSDGVICIDVQKAMSADFVNTALQKNPDYQTYQEFFQETGIDPQKDVFFMAVALSVVSQNTAQASSVVSLKYDKDTIVNLIKEKGKETDILEEEYSGNILYTKKETGEKLDLYGTFLDESHIALGSIQQVKSTIDVSQKKADNLFTNESLNAVIKEADKTAMMWGAFLIPEEVKTKLLQNPMLSSLGGVTSSVFSMDYRDKNTYFEIKIMSADEANSQKIADMLKGFQAMGIMGSAEKPELGELLNRIQISSIDNRVKITAEIPIELMDQLAPTLILD